MENEYISHHGILGQKWGIRRYQNEDGSLTNAGKKHYLRTQKKIDNLRKRADRNYQKRLKNEDRSIDALEKSIMYAYGMGGVKKSDKQSHNYHKISDKYTRKAEGYEIKSYKQNKKADKLMKSLTDKYGDVSVNDLNGDTVSLGEQFTKEATN